MKFEIKEEDISELRDWTKNQMNKGTSRDITGFRFIYCFAPTSLGIAAWVEDRVTNERFELDETSEF
jgi:hypothetical protein